MCNQRRITLETIALLLATRLGGRGSRRRSIAFDLTREIETLCPDYHHLIITPSQIKKPSNNPNRLKPKKSVNPLKPAVKKEKDGKNPKPTKNSRKRPLVAPPPTIQYRIGSTNDVIGMVHVSMSEINVDTTDRVCK